MHITGTTGNPVFFDLDLVIRERHRMVHVVPRDAITVIVNQIDAVV